jgi:hypothetical protein
MLEGQALKRLRKKSRKGFRGWPLATIALYGPNLTQATKIAVGIFPAKDAEATEIRPWIVEQGDIRAHQTVMEEIDDFLRLHGVLTVTMTDRIIGCPHQEGIDYEGEWCPACDFWHGRDRFTGKMIA